MSAYVLGLVTIPAIAGMGWLGLVGAVKTAIALERRGWTVAFKRGRKTDSVIREAAFRSDIWFERQRGPIFTGFWYREYSTPVVTRWVGLGSSNGASLMVFKMSKVGAA